jgi:hypothetical protein
MAGPGSVRPPRMRSLANTFLIAATLTAGCGRSGSPVSSPGIQGQETKQGSSVETRTLTRTDIASGPDRASEYASVKDGEKARAVFSGGDGSSVRNAVVITADSEEAGNRAADIWLHEHYPGSRFQEEHFTYDDGGRYYNEIKILRENGISRTVFFETSSFFGK